MFLQQSEIKIGQLVSDIVANDYRTADVFRKHGITYCCGGKFPLEAACAMRGLDALALQAELEKAVRTVSIPNELDFNRWEPAFLVDYIQHVHHHYLEKTLPQTQALVTEFVEGHSKKFPDLVNVEWQFRRLAKSLEQSNRVEETEVFPYIRQLAHAHKHNEPYASLFIRTMRKPVKETLFKGHESAVEIIFSIRELTRDYTPPEKACINHRVMLSKIKELDNDLGQHLFLEEKILFPKVEWMEKELLEQYLKEPGSFEDNQSA